LSIPFGLVSIGVLLTVGIGAGLMVSWPFMGVLAGYIVITTAYSLALKRMLLIDVLTLAGLYTVRVIAGAAATGVGVSFWLLAFSMFIFTSLALLKRYIELATRLDANLSDPANRNYKIDDLSVVMAMAAASGFNAVTVLALYISSDDVNALYSRPQVLWLICPLLMYWVGRALVLAHRRLIDDDPIVFAIRDRNSLATVICIFLAVALAI